MSEWLGCSSETWETDVQFPALPQTVCVSLGKSLNSCASVLFGEREKKVMGRGQQLFPFNLKMQIGLKTN